MQSNTINLIRHRVIGNCFVNCLIQALTNLGDSGLSKKPRPELEVFDIETLCSSRPENEFRPALNYLISNGYKVKIIDPDPFRNNNWGSNLKHAQVQYPPRNYEVQDVEELSSNDWQVIISTEIDRKPHAVLVANDCIYDPRNESSWKNVKIKTKEMLLDYIHRSDERFLIAIKK